jgi:hypothetical protein
MILRGEGKSWWHQCGFEIGRLKGRQFAFGPRKQRPMGEFAVLNRSNTWGSACLLQVLQRYREPAFSAWQREVRRGPGPRIIGYLSVLLVASYLDGRPRWLGWVLKRQLCKRCAVPTSPKIVFSPKCDLMSRIKSASFRKIATDLIDRSSVLALSSSLEQMTRKTGAVFTSICICPG